MSRTIKDMSLVGTKKSVCPNNFSVVDAENFEPPQQSSTTHKIIRKSSRRVLKNKNSLNISVIKKLEKKKEFYAGNDNQLYKPKLPIIDKNYKYKRVPELFCSDPEDESTEFENKTVSITNDSDDKWVTLSSDVSEDKNFTNISDFLTEIDTDVQVTFEKPPRRSYPGRKRNNKTLFEEKEEVKETEVQKCKKPKKKKKVDVQEEAFIQSINEHFKEVEAYGLIVE